MAYEADLEAWCRMRALQNGGYLLKWTSPGNRGVPDRILLMPRFIAFIEFKSPGGVLSALQGVWLDRLRVQLKLNHYVVRHRHEFNAIMEDAAREAR